MKSETNLEVKQPAIAGSPLIQHLVCQAWQRDVIEQYDWMDLSGKLRPIPVDSPDLGEWLGYAKHFESHSGLKVRVIRRTEELVILPNVEASKRPMTKTPSRVVRRFERFRWNKAGNTPERQEVGVEVEPHDDPTIDEQRSYDALFALYPEWATGQPTKDGIGWSSALTVSPDAQSVPEHQPESDPAVLLGQLISRLRTPGLKSDVKVCVAALLDRVANPNAFIPEAVADAKHDLKLLAGIA
jgi:hypothetical protein